MRTLWKAAAVVLAAGLIIWAYHGLSSQELEAAKNLGAKVNSPDSEIGPIIAADGKKLFFTSDRAGGQGGQDIWVSDRKDGKWTEPRNLGDEVNTKYNEGPDSVSVDNRTIYFTRCDKVGDPGTCDIYTASLDESMDKWTNVENLGSKINSEFNDANASISSSGNTLYYVSDRPTDDNTRRDWDIFVSHKKGNRWTKGERVSDTINTSGNEIHVMIHQDGKSFYFSSDGHGGFGKADIFISKLKPDGSFGKPKNLGPHINTPENDMYFTVPAAGDLAYLASNRETSECRTDCTSDEPDCGCMEDLYSVPIPVIHQPEGVILVKGVVANQGSCDPPTTDEDSGAAVYDIETCDPIEGALVRMAEVKTDKAIKEKETGPSGSYQVTIPAGKDYSITATAENYSFHSERFNVPKTQAYKVITKNILLQKATVGTTIVLNNVYFDFDKATLRDESKNELSNAIRWLKKHPEIRIEVGGHTDAKGSDSYNIRLSRARAKSVYKYLVREGNINPDRLESTGYGERMPIASNATDEGRQLNRRVEFKIIE
ncbi:MAG: OmpA family protein [bacterium]